MNRKFLGIVLLAMAIFGQSLFAIVAAQQTEASWTLMVYMDADNNLEADALADILEMESVGSTDLVNIVVQIDRADGYSGGDGDWTDARRYLVTHNAEAGTIKEITTSKTQNPEGVTLGSQPVEMLGEIDNGDPQTLVDFIVWSAQNYPADKYGLVMWDHGGTWIGGFGGDSSTPNRNSINLPELDAALSLATEAIGQNFEMIGFDTCLMGQYEVFSILSKYANFAAGSEELEPGYGWYYTPSLAALVDNPNMDGRELSQQFVRDYQKFYDEIWQEFTGKTYSDFVGGGTYGQSALDLSQMAALNSALNNFSQVVRDNMDAALLAAIGDARNNTQMFLRESPDSAQVFAAVDLLHFMDLLQRFSTNTEVNTAAQNVVDKINDAVILNQATNMPGAHGLSIYFPAYKELYTVYGLDGRYQQEAQHMAEWIAFLEAFYDEAILTASTSTGSVIIRALYSQNASVNTLSPPTLVFESEGTNITGFTFTAILHLSDEIQFMVDQTSLVSATVTEDGEPIVDIPDGVSLTSFTWPVDVPVVTDGTVSVQTVLLETGNEDSVVVTGLYGFQNGDTLDAYLVFDLETRQATKVWGINRSENGEQPFEIDVNAGDEFLPTWRYFDENGALQFIPAEVVLTFGDEPFSFDFEPAASGIYSLSIHMTDIAGNFFADTLEVTVDNSGMQSDYRGYSDIYFGYSLVYPWEWIEPIDIEYEGGGVSTVFEDNDGIMTVYLDYYDVTSLQEIEDIAFGYLDDFAIEYTDPVDIVLGGYDGYEIKYRAETVDGTPIYGAVLVTYVEENGLGYVIDFEVTGEFSEVAEKYYIVLINSIAFFPPLE